MDVDEDVIIEEIPVFLSKNLESNLYIYQYPMKTHLTNFDMATIVNSCIKPINNEVKIDLALMTDSKNYDSFKGEKFAEAADGKTRNKGDQLTFKSGTMDKQSYISTKPIDNVNKYVVGMYQDKEIHLSPINAIIQLRPTFSYFDKEDKRIKAEEKIATNDDDDEEIEKVTVKFAEVGSDKVKKAKEKAYDHFVQKSNDEPWCETFWHSAASSAAVLERQKLFATKREFNHALDLDAVEYSKKLITVQNENLTLEPHWHTQIISKTKLRQLNLNDQLKVILKDGKMLTFDNIISILEECNLKVIQEKVVRELLSVGILIRGNWVPQSEILYPNGSNSNMNGVEATLMRRGRDYTLYKFSRVEFLIREKVMASIQLPPEETLEILQTIGKLNIKDKWELKLPPDSKFEARHQELCQRQELIWKASEQLYVDMDYETKRTRKISVRESKRT